MRRVKLLQGDRVVLAQRNVTVLVVSKRVQQHLIVWVNIGIQGRNRLPLTNSFGVAANHLLEC